MVSSPINLLHQIAPRRRSTPVSHCTFLDALSRLVLLAFPEARRCPADRPITGGEKKCPINPLSPPDSDHFPANSAFPRGMTIPRDMDRSQMLREGRLPVPRGMSSPPYPGSIYRPIWDPSSSNTTKIFWGRHICSLDLLRRRDPGQLCCHRHPVAFTPPESPPPTRSVTSV